VILGSEERQPLGQGYPPALRPASGTTEIGSQAAVPDKKTGLESTFEVAEYDPPHAFGLRALDGPIPLDGRWRLQDDGGTTRVEFVGEGPVRGALRPFGALLQRSLARRFRGYHATLRALLER